MSLRTFISKLALPGTRLLFVTLVLLCHGRSATRRTATASGRRQVSDAPARKRRSELRRLGRSSTTVPSTSMTIARLGAGPGRG